jgi:hypothetical protein
VLILAQIAVQRFCGSGTGWETRRDSTGKGTGKGTGEALAGHWQTTGRKPVDLPVAPVTRQCLASALAGALAGPPRVTRPSRMGAPVHLAGAPIRLEPVVKVILGCGSWSGDTPP